MDATLDLLMSILRTKFKVTRPTAADADINEIGLDSLDVINFLFSVEEETGVKLPDEVIKAEDLHTLGEFAAYIAAQSGAAGVAAKHG